MNEGNEAIGAQVFDFAAAPAMQAENFFVSNVNRTAFKLITDHGSWPNRKLAIVGEACSGKTHLANIWASRSGREIVRARELELVDINRLGGLPGVAIDDAYLVEGSAVLEEALLRLHNLLAERGGYMLMTARNTPSRWRIELPDLQSRLAASHVVAMGLPDDEHLEALLLKHFSDRQIFVARSTVVYILARVERSCQAVQNIADALDKLSLARGRPITRAIASELLSEARQRGLA